MAKYPGWNWVICHTKHKTDFKGEHHHRHEEFKVSFGKTIGYEIYWFKAGTFERQGDGGYLNVSPGSLSRLKPVSNIDLELAVVLWWEHREQVQGWEEDHIQITAWCCSKGRLITDL